MLFMLIHTVTKVFSMASHENTLNRITFYAKSISLFFFFKFLQRRRQIQRGILHSSIQQLWLVQKKKHFIMFNDLPFCNLSTC